jgi:hypothetical protein
MTNSKAAIRRIPEVLIDESSVEVDNITSDEDRARLEELKGGVALHEIPAALRFLEGLYETSAARNLAASLIRQWAVSDAWAASKWAEKMPAGVAKTRALKGVGIEYANQDVMKSIQWAWDLPEGSDRSSVIQSIGYEASRIEPVAALTIAVGSLPVSVERDDLIKHASMQWATSEPRDAAEWAIQLQDVRLRSRVIVNVATAWSNTDPESAADFAVLNIEPGRAQNDAVVGIVQRWVQVDPEAAADWVASFPEGELFDTAAENLRKLWPSSTL